MFMLYTAREDKGLKQERVKTGKRRYNLQLYNIIDYIV